MPWTCPICGRSFRTTGQAHSCQMVDVASHLAGKPDWVRDAFTRLDRFAIGLGSVQRAAISSGITYLAPVTFLMLKPKSKGLEVEFVTTAPIEESPVYKVFQFTKAKWANYVRISELGEVDERLLNLIAGAYRLVAEQGLAE